MLRSAATDEPAIAHAHWRDLHDRNLVLGPDAFELWKTGMAQQFGEQLQRLGEKERRIATDLVGRVIRDGVATGRAPAERGVAGQLRGIVRDSLLDSRWPTVLAVQLVAGAVGVRTVELDELGVDPAGDPDGERTLEALLPRLGYCGGLEFFFLAFTSLAHRHGSGHTAHRNDFVDQLITASVRCPTDRFVTEERWWRAYLEFPGQVTSVAEALTVTG